MTRTLFPGDGPTPYYQDEAVSLYLGDCREVLRAMEAESVQTCITSPPYWSLRDYGIEPGVWGGDAECEHEWGSESLSGQRLRNGADGGLHEGRETNTLLVNTELSQGATCCRCGAWRGCLGLEPTPEMFVAHMVEVFREVWRVLRKDGTAWVTLGDSYNAYNGNRGPSPSISGDRQHPKHGRGLVSPGLKPKDLVGIPWRVAFALQADGWWLRQDIIWHKPNPMPESVQDRCTKAHEMIFLLAKSGRYYYDADAIREPSTERASGNVERFIASGNERQRLNTHLGSSVPFVPDGTGRNKRDVWTIPTSPFSGAHFATFPPALVRPMILAGAPEGGVALDPFAGVGTAIIEAKRLGRRAIGIDMSAANLAMAAQGLQLRRRPGKAAKRVKGQGVLSWPG